MLTFLRVTRYWRYSKENMEKLYNEGRVVQTKPGSVHAYKRYLDDGQGVPLGSVWDDIGPVQGAAAQQPGDSIPISILISFAAVRHQLVSSRLVGFPQPAESWWSTRRSSTAGMHLCSGPVTCTDKRSREQIDIPCSIVHRESVTCPPNEATEASNTLSC